MTACNNMFSEGELFDYLKPYAWLFMQCVQFEFM